MKKRVIIFMSIITIMLGISAAADAEIFIIVNNEVPVDSLSKKDARDIYLGHITKWNTGKKIVIVILKRGKTHDDFTRNILGIAPEKLARFWKRAFFSGSGNLPKICNTEERMVEIVAKYPGAIGYIDSETEHPPVKSFPLR